MKLTTLNALVAAVEEGSLRGAARQVGISQPALTKMVRELELELGAALLQRTSRGVVPTPQGKVLYERAVKAQRELGLAQRHVDHLASRQAALVTLYDQLDPGQRKTLDTLPQTLGSSLSPMLRQRLEKTPG